MTRWLMMPMAALVAACGEPSGVPATVTDLAGTWTARAITVTNDLDPSLREDLFALGVRWEVTIAETGEFMIALSNPFGSDTQEGQLTIEGDSMILAVSDVPDPPRRESIHYVYTGDRLTLTFLGTEQCGSYGWQAEECPIPATFRLTTERSR